MQTKAKPFGQIYQLFFNTLGPQRSLNFLNRFSRSSPNEVQFPLTLSLIQKIFICLPRNDVDAVHQLKNVLSICAIYKNTKIYCLCEKNLNWIGALIPGIEIFEYPSPDKWKLFSNEFNALKSSLQNQIDMAIILDRAPDITTTYFVKSINAKIRIGFETPITTNFLNIKARISSSPTYIPEQNCLIADIIGAPRGKKMKWAVSKNAQNELPHLLREHGLETQKSLVCLDVAYFAANYDEAWVRQLIASMPKGTAPYAFARSTDSPAVLSFMKQCKIPIIGEISVSRLAALLNYSACVISGNSFLFALSLLLETKTIGIFSETDFVHYCPVNNPNCKGITYKEALNSSHIQQIVTLIPISSKGANNGQK